MFEELTDALDGMVLPIDGAVLAEATRFLDHARAKISALAGEFDALELWDVEGATSLGAWLRTSGGMTHREAARMATTAKRLHRCPVTRAAWEAGELTGGQIDAITANVNEKTAALYAEHEPVIVPLLAGKDVQHSTAVMRNWADRAKTALGLDDPKDEQGTAHLSSTLDGRGRLDADLDPEGFEVVRKAIRLASAKQGPDDTRTPAQRRHDGVVTAFRFFLDHQDIASGGQHRPHLNLVFDGTQLVAGTGQGSYVDSGAPLAVTDALRHACDANVHRVVTERASTTLDYGRATRTVPANLFTVIARRDGGCRFPGCDRSVSWTQAHHIVHWCHGGTTDEWNLALFCDRHHHVIHRPRWRVRMLPGGRIEVTDPSGWVRTSDPPTPTALPLAG